MIQRVAFGMPTEKTARATDLNWCEMATVVPLIVLIFWIGVFPNPFLTPMHASVAHVFKVMKRGSDTLHADYTRPSTARRPVATTHFLQESNWWLGKWYHDTAKSTHRT